VRTVNAIAIHASLPSLPFGGVGQSGMHAHHAHERFLTFAARYPWPLALLTLPWAADDLGQLTAAVARTAGNPNRIVSLVRYASAPWMIAP
jgi:hypothetical protein